MAAVFELVTSDGGVRVEIAGELDDEGAEELDRVLRGISSQYDGDQVVLDLLGVTSIDLAAVERLDQAAYRMQSSGRLRLRASALVLDALRAGGVGERFTVVG